MRLRRNLPRRRCASGGTEQVSQNWTPDSRDFPSERERRTGVNQKVGQSLRSEYSSPIVIVGLFLFVSHPPTPNERRSPARLQDRSRLLPRTSCVFVYCQDIGAL
ncbi:hypothetical protein NDU88_008013 [Pleurodeles waltl]|uniref:Uncharacterized protein n=1 Tax=Pleurodeles waltl TaxID=8319 RepID=A0AAV7PQW8_PLEWA|nr:hypothetical protein NDU88_008013 [Pleurodeles waltl]